MTEVGRAWAWGPLWEGAELPPGSPSFATHVKAQHNPSAYELHFFFFHEDKKLGWGRSLVTSCLRLRRAEGDMGSSCWFPCSAGMQLAFLPLPQLSGCFFPL